METLHSPESPKGRAPEAFVGTNGKNFVTHMDSIPITEGTWRLEGVNGKKTGWRFRFVGSGLSIRVEYTLGENPWLPKDGTGISAQAFLAKTKEYIRNNEEPVLIREAKNTSAETTAAKSAQKEVFKPSEGVSRTALVEALRRFDTEEVFIIPANVEEMLLRLASIANAPHVKNPNSKTTATFNIGRGAQYKWTAELYQTTQKPVDTSSITENKPLEDHGAIQINIPIRGTAATLESGQIKTAFFEGVETLRGMLYEESDRAKKFRAFLDEKNIKEIHVAISWQLGSTLSQTLPLPERDPFAECRFAFLRTEEVRGSYWNEKRESRIADRLTDTERQEKIESLLKKLEEGSYPNITAWRKPLKDFLDLVDIEKNRAPALSYTSGIFRYKNSGRLQEILITEDCTYREFCRAIERLFEERTSNFAAEVEKTTAAITALSSDHYLANSENREAIKKAIEYFENSPQIRLNEISKRIQGADRFKITRFVQSITGRSWSNGGFEILYEALKHTTNS